MQIVVDMDFVEYLFLRQDSRFVALKWCVVAFGGVSAVSSCAIGNMEPQIDANDGIENDDDKLDNEIEAVECRAGVVPSGVIGWAGHESDTGAECGAQSEHRGGDEEDGDLMSETAFAEFVDAGLLRDYDAKDDEWDGEECEDGEPGAADEGEFAVLQLDGFVECVEAVNGGGDD